METIKTEDVLAVKELTNELMLKNKTMSVTTDIECKQAGEYAAQLQNLKKSIQDYFSPLKTQANKLHKDLCSKEKDEVSPLEKEIDRVKVLIGAYYAEIERIRKEEQRILDEKRRAEESRIRAEEEAARVEAAKIQDAQEREKKEAEIENMKFIPPTPVVLETKPDVKLGFGKMSGVEQYSFDIQDPFQLVKALSEGLIPMECVSISLRIREMTAFAKEAKEEMVTEFPGIKTTITTNMRISG